MEAVDEWEAAYVRFETPEEEIRKFVKRLNAAGAATWPRDIEIVELFSGRCNGLRGLQALGFTRFEGMDLSPALLARYDGPAKCIVGDCRSLPFANASKDRVIIQGGLHHLPGFPDDVDKVLGEVRRVLRPDGRVMIVEPWPTAFLSLVHVACRNPLARKLYPKLDALATMIHHERRTYEQWLGNSSMVLELLKRHFVPERLVMAWGKIFFYGRPIAATASSR
jgi:SAM-dependent methyltransferase